MHYARRLCLTGISQDTIFFYIRGAMDGIEILEYTLFDKLLLAHIRQMLDKCNIPSSYGVPKRFCSHAKRIGANYQREACQLLVSLKDTDSMSSVAAVSCALKVFITQHYPSNMYNMVQINKNCVSKKHQDSGNIGHSTLVGLGSYTDGKTVFHLQGGDHEVDISNMSATFRAQDIPHSSQVFEGVRYSLVFFCADNKKKSGKQRMRQK